MLILRMVNFLSLMQHPFGFSWSRDPKTPNFAPHKCCRKFNDSKLTPFLAHVFPGNDCLPFFLRLRRDLRLMIEFARVSTLST